MESRNYLLAGASSGMGAALKTRLEEAGHRVFTLGRRNLDSDNHHYFDASSEELFSYPATWPEMLHGFAYLPGTIQLKPFHRTQEADFLSDFRINVLGFVRLLQVVLPNLKRAGGASVVTFSTVAANTGLGFHSSISASKGALQALCFSLAAELAPSGIRVNCIAPSITDTPLAASLLGTAEKREASAKRHALGRVGTAEDMAASAAFLLSPDSGWITAQVLGVDGGFSRLR
jgi:NAD(P)-dependent dehydrogenase (short-subunit alcohol dehydrogenase family)